jgi:ABC-type molybdate transport system substrate-binding protein
VADGASNQIGRRGILGAAGALALLPGGARAEWLRDEIVAYADPELRPVMSALGARFRATRGVRVRTFCAAPGQMLGLLAHGTQDDVLITQTGPMAEAAQRALVQGSPRKLWRNRLVFAARGDGAREAVFDAGGLAASLGEGRLALPDASDACTVDGPALLIKLTLGEKLSGRVLGVADTEDAVATLRRGEAVLALCHASEVAGAPDLRVAMPVPDDAYDPIEYAAALSHGGWSRYQDPFLAWLAADAMRAVPQLGLEALA